MENPGYSERKHDLWTLAAWLAPVIHCASSETWPMVLLMVCVAFILGRWTAVGTGWVLVAQRCWSAFVVAALMRWSSAYWQGQEFLTVVPFALLALAVWTVSVPGKAARITCVLLVPLMVMLGAVLLSGISEIRLEYLKPGLYVPDLSLLAVLLISSLPAGRGKRNWKLPAIGILAATVTAGVLSANISRKADAGIYELSRSLSLLGLAERFESLVAAAMTMGFYAAMAYLLEPLEEGEKIWPYGLLAAALYPFIAMLQGWMIVLGTLIAYLLLPRFVPKK